MKKLVFLLTIVIILASLTGCTEKAINEEPQIVSQEPEPLDEIKEKDKLSILGNYEKALQILDFQLKSGVDDRINLQDEIGVVELQKVDDVYYLASYYNYPRYPMTSLFYSMVNIENETVDPILVLSPDDYIEDVYIDIDNMTVRFVYGGRNIINGFKEYPFDIIYNVKDKTYLVENEYTKIDRYPEITLGNSMNIVGLKSIKGNEEEIRFKFTEVEGTILAGGNFCPNITIGRVADKGYITGEEPPKLYIDFENTLLTKGSKEQILALEKLDYITNAEIREYLDAKEANHVVVYLTVKDVEEYKGQFTIAEDDAFLEFRLLFNLIKQ